MRADTLPKLGTDRRVILSSQRLLGHRAIEDSGAEVVFDGGPDGWPEVSRAVYSFAANRLHHVVLELERDTTDVSNHQRFWRLRDALAAQSGQPAFDRVRDSDNSPSAVMPTQVDATVWRDGDVDTTVAATYGAQRSLTVTIVRDHDFTSEVAAITDQSAQALGGPALVLAMRAASERLLDDFGDQRIIEEGAKHKGRPIAIRLAAVKLPAQLASGTDAVNERFARFVSGDWDVAAVSEGGEADVDLVIDVEPIAGGEGYAMRLLAHFARGKNQGQLFYGATMVIR